MIQAANNTGTLVITDPTGYVWHPSDMPILADELFEVIIAAIEQGNRNVVYLLRLYRAMVEDKSSKE